MRRKCDLVYAVEKLHKACMRFLQSINNNKVHQMSGAQLVFLSYFIENYQSIESDEMLLKNIAKTGLFSTDMSLYFLNTLQHNNSIIKDLDGLKINKNIEKLFDKISIELSSIEKDLKPILQEDITEFCEKLTKTAFIFEKHIG